MGKVYDLLVRGRGDARDAQRAMRDLRRSSSNLSRAIGVDSRSIMRYTAMGLGAGLAATVAVGARELLEAGKVSAQTGAALKSTGGAANVTKRGIENLASSLSSLSGIDDELIQQGSNLLLTFTNIRNEVGRGNDVFNQATAAALDMSVALGEDMTSSAMRIGKALNDPIKGVTALRRVGVQLTDQQEKQIKAFTKNGDTMRAQKVILAELRKEFGGSAKEFGGSAAGAIGKLRNEYEELSGELVGKAAPSLLLVANRAREGVAAIRSWSQTDAGQAAIDDVRDGVETLGNTLMSTVGFVVRHRSSIVALGTAYAGARVGAYAAGVAVALYKFAQAAKAATVSMGALRAMMLTNPVGIAAAAVGALVGATTLLILKEREKQQALERSETKVLRQAQALGTLKNAQDRLSNARLSVQGTALAAERAELMYQDAIRQSGRGSLEAREALHQLRQARQDHRTALKDESKAQDEGMKKNREAFSTYKQQSNLLQRRAQLTLELKRAQQDLAKVNPYSKEAGELQKHIRTVGRNLQKLESQTKHSRETLETIEKQGWTRRNQYMTNAMKRELTTTGRGAQAVSVVLRKGVDTKPKLTTFTQALQSGMTKAGNAAHPNAVAAGTRLGNSMGQSFASAIGTFANSASTLIDRVESRVQAAAAASALAGGRSRSKGALGFSGINVFGTMQGAGANLADVLSYANLSSGSVYSQTSDGGVVTNEPVKSFIEQRIAAAKKQINVYLRRRRKAIGQLTVARKDLQKAFIALGKARKLTGKKRASAIEKAQAAVSKAQDRVGNIQGRIEFFESEIMSLGGQIDSDAESLIPPDATGGDGGGDTGDDTSTSTTTGDNESLDSSDTISRLQQQLSASQQNQAASEAALAAFGGPGDIGNGLGMNAWQSATSRRATQIHFHSTVPYTQEQARMVAQMTRQGYETDGTTQRINDNRKRRIGA